MGKNKKKTKSRPALQINLGTGETTKPTASDSQAAPQAQEQAPQPAIPQVTQTGSDADVWDPNVWSTRKKKKEREASQAEDKLENQPKDQQQDQSEATQDDETPKSKDKPKTKKPLVANRMPRSLIPQHAQDQQQPQAKPSQAAPPPGGSWAGMVATTPAQPSQTPQVWRPAPLRAGPVVGAVGPVTPGPQQTTQKAPQQVPQPLPQKARQQASQQAISPASRSASSSAQGPNVQKGTRQPTRVANQVEGQSIGAQGDLVQKLSNLRLDDIIPLPVRVGLGVQGEPTNVEVNYFPLQGLQALILYQYGIAIVGGPRGPIDPDQRHPLRLKHSIYAKVLERFPNSNIATNYVNKLICTDMLPSPQTIQVNVAESEQNATNYSVEIRYERTYRFNEVLTDLESASAIIHPDFRNEAIQALNIVLAHYPNVSRNIYPLGQSKHFLPESATSQDLGQGLIGLKGFFHSVRPSTSGLLLNVNFSAGAFYNPVSVSDLISAFDPRQSYFQSKHGADALKRFLKGLAVETSYGDTTRIRTISSIAVRRDGKAAKPREVSFNSGGMFVTVEQYFHQNYGQISWDQVVVQFGTDANRMAQIPAELCTVVAGQAARQKLSSNQTTNMIRFACRRPDQNRASIINDGLGILGATSPDLHGPAQRFAVNIDTQLLRVTGRVLRTPTLQYSSGQHRPQKGTWNLMKSRFFESGTTGGELHLGLLKLVGNRENNMDREVANFERCLENALRSSGVNFTRVRWTSQNVPVDTRLSQDSQSANIRKIGTALNQFKSQNAQLVVVVLPTQDAHVFSRVKHLADVTIGIHTLCIRQIYNRKERRDYINTNGTYMANLTLKVNLKLGGINHKLARRSPDLLMGDTMFIGIDVTHPTGTENAGGSNRRRSIAAVVANVDESLGQWPGSIRTQADRQEMVSDLRDMVRERLEAWKRQDNLPSRVVVYRDGVSESQYQQVLRDELPQINHAIEMYFNARPGTTVPNVTLLVVGKRHHTRFYPADEMKDNTNNVLPGTVVDQGCTMERGNDFFMVAHKGIQGTCRPAHYVVLQDNNGYSPDEMQEMTHNLSYVYGRATRAVSIATPAYLADRLCDRGRCYLYDAYNGHSSLMEGGDWVRDVHGALNNTMFYI